MTIFNSEGKFPTSMSHQLEVCYSELSEEILPSIHTPLPRKIQGSLDFTSSEQLETGWYIYAKFKFLFNFESCQPLQKHNKSNLSSMTCKQV